MTVHIKGLEKPHPSPPTPPKQYERRLTVPEIEAALHSLLTSIEDDEIRQAQTSRKPARLRCLSVCELAKTDPAVWKVEDLISDPIARACREQIKVLGKLLFALTGSTDAMLETLERVADLSPLHAGKRYDILDKWWNGIGNGNDMWCA